MYHPGSATGSGMVDSSGLSVVSASDCGVVMSTFVGVGIRGAGGELEVGRSIWLVEWFIFLQET